MAEIRDCEIMVNIEATFFEIVKDLCKKERMSASSYTRTLIIEDLLRRGLLTETILAQVLTGRTA